MEFFLIGLIGFIFAMLLVLAVWTIYWLLYCDEDDDD